MVFRYEKKLDNDKNLEFQSRHYDEADVETVFDVSTIKVNKAKNKRISMIIPFGLYQEAQRVGELTGTGYQNALKVAMAIGFQNLEKSLGIKV